MSVYFIRSEDLIKIGYSNDVRQRTDAVIRMLRAGGTYLGYMAGDRSVEKYLHAKFADLREYGEWFKSSPDLETFIAVSTTEGYPEDEKISSTDRLLLQEERYAEEASYFIRAALSGLPTSFDTFETLTRITTIPAHRLQDIYHGKVCPVTAGEYVILRMVYEAETNQLPGSDK